VAGSDREHAEWSGSPSIPFGGEPNVRLESVRRLSGRQTPLREGSRRSNCLPRALNSFPEPSNPIPTRNEHTRRSGQDSGWLRFFPDAPATVPSARVAARSHRKRSGAPGSHPPPGLFPEGPRRGPGARVSFPGAREGKRGAGSGALEGSLLRAWLEGRRGRRRSQGSLRSYHWCCVAPEWSTIVRPLSSSGSKADCTATLPGPQRRTQR
jgi:hypothetical protein